MLPLFPDSPSFQEVLRNSLTAQDPRQQAAWQDILTCLRIKSEPGTFCSATELYANLFQRRRRERGDTPRPALISAQQRVGEDQTEQLVFYATDLAHSPRVFCSIFTVAVAHTAPNTMQSTHVFIQSSLNFKRNLIRPLGFVSQVHGAIQSAHTQVSNKEREGKDFITPLRQGVIIQPKKRFISEEPWPSGSSLHRKETGS